MSAGRPRKYHHPETISGRVPGYKKDILDILEIPPTQVINTGINVTLENVLHQGRVSKDVLDLYISNLKQEILELEERISRAERIRDHFIEEARKESEVITVYDLDLNEKVRIKRSEVVPEKHAMIAGRD